MQRTLFQFMRYQLVGVVTYGVDISAFLVLLMILDIDLLLANMISKVLAGLFAFFAHRMFTFGVVTSTGRGRQVIFYFSLLALNVPLSALILSAVLWVIPVEVVAKVLSDVILVLISYFQLKFIVFKTQRDDG